MAWRRPSLVVLAASLILTLSGTAPSRATSSTTSFSVALPAGQQATWFVPDVPGSQATDANVLYFQRFLYRPLYWFNGSANYQPSPSTSLAFNPVYSSANHVVTITLKPGNHWSNGTPVTTSDLVFFLNLITAYPSSWAGDTPSAVSGTAFSLPSLINSVTVVNAATVTMQLSRAVNPTWFTANELSQLTPLPSSWDVMPTSSSLAAYPAGLPTSSLFTSNGGVVSLKPAGCWATNWIGNGNHGPSTGSVPGETQFGRDPEGEATVVTDQNVATARACLYTHATLRAAAYDRAAYGETGTTVNALVTTSDGPWRLTSFNASTGATTFTAANPTTKAANQLNMVPCATSAACLNLVTSGAVDVATLDPSVLPATSNAVTARSAQPLNSKGYTLTTMASSSSNVLLENFASTWGAKGAAGVALANPVIKSALTLATDQSALGSLLYRGWSLPTTGPVPPVIPSKTSLAISHANPTSAWALLRAHGWSLSSTGTAQCTRPGTTATSCGAGITAGTPLSFTMEYVTDHTTRDAGALEIQREWAKIGVALTLRAVSLAVAATDVYDSLHPWDLVWFGTGWRYGLKSYPTAEDFLSSLGRAPAGTPPSMDSILTMITSGTTTLPAYNNWVAKSGVAIYLPTPLNVVAAKTFHHEAFNPLGTLTPETWRR